MVPVGRDLRRPFTTVPPPEVKSPARIGVPCRRRRRPARLRPAGTHRFGALAAASGSGTPEPAGSSPAEGRRGRGRTRWPSPSSSCRAGAGGGWTGHRRVLLGLAHTGGVGDEIEDEAQRGRGTRRRPTGPTESPGRPTQDPAVIFGKPVAQQGPHERQGSVDDPLGSTQVHHGTNSNPRPALCRPSAVPNGPQDHAPGRPGVFRSPTARRRHDSGPDPVSSR